GWGGGVGTGTVNDPGAGRGSFGNRSGGSKKLIQKEKLDDSKRATADPKSPAEPTKPDTSARGFGLFAIGGGPGVQLPSQGIIASEEQTLGEADKKLESFYGRGSPTDPSRNLKLLDDDALVSPVQQAQKAFEEPDSRDVDPIQILKKDRARKADSKSNMTGPVAALPPVETRRRTLGEADLSDGGIDSEVPQTKKLESMHKLSQDSIRLDAREKRLELSAKSTPANNARDLADTEREEDQREGRGLVTKDRERSKAIEFDSRKDALATDDVFYRKIEDRHDNGLGVKLQAGATTHDFSRAKSDDKAATAYFFDTKGGNASEKLQQHVEGLGWQWGEGKDGKISANQVLPQGYDGQLTLGTNAVAFDYADKKAAASKGVKQDVAIAAKDDTIRRQDSNLDFAERATADEAVLNANINSLNNRGIKFNSNSEGVKTPPVENAAIGNGVNNNLNFQSTNFGPPNVDGTNAANNAANQPVFMLNNLNGGTISNATNGVLNLARQSDGALKSFNGDLDGDPVISNGRGITLNGVGTLTLSGTSSYTGGTSVSAGTLAISGENDNRGTNHFYIDQQTNSAQDASNLNREGVDYIVEPAVYETRTRKICVTPETCVKHPVPSVYETRTRQVCVKPATPTEPAIYRTEEYKVCVNPASCTTETIPSVFKDEEYRVCIKPETRVPVSNKNKVIVRQFERDPELDQIQSELSLRGYRALREENPKLTYPQFLLRPEVVHPVVLTDEGLDEDEYVNKFGTRPFVDCARDHLSTFGMDVDTAAYTLARSMLRSDKLPTPDSVKVEEFVNYFKQAYQVLGDDAFGVFAESAQSPFVDTNVRSRDAALLGSDNVHTRELLKIGIKSRAARPGERKPAMLTFVVDTSGSMSKAGIKDTSLSRLAIVKQALTALVESLTPDDAIGIVGYGDQAELILPRTQARHKQRILDAIDSMTPGGSTNIDAGVNLGYRMADEAYATNAVNRMILFSDGVANVGEKGPGDLVKLVTLFAGRGIDLSTVGIGQSGAKDPMMRTLADAGNGSYHAADTMAELQKILLEKLPPHLNVLARDAKVQVDFNVDTVKSYRLLGYEKRKIADKDFRNDKIDSGDVGHDTLVTVFYEIVRQTGVRGSLGKVYLRWKDAGSPRLDVVERNYPLEESTYAGAAQNASPDFRFLACVARFAELLRESKWTRHGSYAEVIAELNRLPQDFRAKPEWSEVKDLIERAQRLSIAKWKTELEK
ncbi:MAG: von Willebrand factor type A domain-containing protein, partial [Planctomycetota bacterium]